MARKRIEEPKYGTPDEESPEWTAEMIAEARPFAEVMAEQGISISPESLRGPHRVTVTTSVDIPVEIVNHFKDGGSDWEMRLREVLKNHVDGSARRKKSA